MAFTFDTVQSSIKTRLDADSWFVSNGITSILWKSGTSGAVDQINETVESAVRSKGLAFLVRSPSVQAIDSHSAGRGLLHTVVEIMILENPEANRKSSGVGATGVVAAVETMKALFGHSQISPADEVYEEMEGPSGLTAYVVRAKVECDFLAR